MIINTNNKYYNLVQENNLINIDPFQFNFIIIYIFIGFGDTMVSIKLV